MSGTGSGDAAKGIGVVLAIVGTLMTAVWWVESDRTRLLSLPQRTVKMQQLAEMVVGDQNRNIRVVDYQFLPSYAVETKNGRWEEVTLALIPAGSNPIGTKAAAVVTLHSARSEKDVDAFVMQDKVAGIRSATRTTKSKAFAKLAELNRGVTFDKAWNIEVGGSPTSQGLLLLLLIGGILCFGAALVCGLIWLGIFGGTRAAGAPPKQALFDDELPPGMRA